MRVAVTVMIVMMTVTLTLTLVLVIVSMAFAVHFMANILTIPPYRSDNLGGRFETGEEDADQNREENYPEHVG